MRNKGRKKSLPSQKVKIEEGKNAHYNRKKKELMSAGTQSSLAACCLSLFSAKCLPEWQNLNSKE